MQMVTLLLYLEQWPSYFLLDSFFFVSSLEALSHCIFLLVCFDFSFSHLLYLFFHFPYLDSTSSYVFPHFIQDGLKISQCLYDQVLLHQIFLICIHRLFSLWIWSDKMVFKLHIIFHNQVLNFSVNLDRQKSHSYLNTQCESIILLIILHLSIVY